MYDEFFNFTFIFISLILILLRILFLCSKKKRPSKLSMIGYKIVYTDQKEKTKLKGVDYGVILYSAKYDIQGKPDYIFKSVFGSNFVPVEIKSGLIKNEPMPHKGDFMQLAAYFLLIEDVYGVKPKFGMLIYKDYMFKIRNTARIRKEVLKQLHEMRQMLETGKGRIPEPSFVKCRYCVCNHTVCKFCEKRD